MGKKRRSPESVFIRTGRAPKGFDPKRAERLGIRFLSRQWHKKATEKREVPWQRSLHSGKEFMVADCQRKTFRK